MIVKLPVNGNTFHQPILYLHVGTDCSVLRGITFVKRNVFKLCFKFLIHHNKTIVN
jgi:hypothetical protein